MKTLYSHTTPRWLVLIALSAVVTVACKDDATSKAGTASEAVDKGASEEAVATKEAPPGPAAATTTEHELDGIGYLIDTPLDWKLKKFTETAYKFRITSRTQADGSKVAPSLQIMKSSFGPTTLAFTAKRCRGELLDKGQTDTAFFYNCAMETAGIKYMTAEYVIKEGEDYIVCSVTGLELDIMNAACGSLRKK